MPLYRRGSNLHGANAYRLVNQHEATILSSNNIGSHPVYTARVNESNTYNRAHVNMLSNYIANRLRNYSSPNTKRKLKNMTNAIFNKRAEVQKGHEQNYMRKFALYKERVETLRSLRKFLENQHQPVANITSQINAETAAYTAATNQWVRHQNQLKYWRWVKNVVVPAVYRKI